jgi:hypothetical protein
MALAGCVFDEDDITRAEMTNLAVAGLHRPGAREQDMEQASWCTVHFSRETRWQIEEPDSLSRLPLGDRKGRWGIVSEFNNDVLEVALAVRPGEQAHVLHVPI